MRTVRTGLLVVVLVAALCPVARAQRAKEQDAPPAAVSRVYDVRDLIVSVPDYPFHGTMIPGRRVEVPPVTARGGLFGGAPPATAPAAAAMATRSRTRQEMIDEIIRLVTETVAPDSWRDAGGTVGAVREINGQLIVTQTPENHEQLVSLLTQLRQTKAKMVRVLAQWLLLPPVDADKLLGQGAPEGRLREAPQRMDPALLAKLPEGAARFRGETLGLNAQTVHVVSGPTRTVVTDVDAQIGTGAAGFDPVVDVARSGLMLQVTPTLSADGRTALVDLHSAFVSAGPDGQGIRARASAAPETAGEGGGPTRGGATTPEVTVDRLDATVQELRTTVVVPIARPILIGGMTLNAEPGKPDAPQLYLVIEVIASEEGGAAAQ